MRLQQRVVEFIAGVAALYFILISSRLLNWLGIFVPLPRHRAIGLLFALFLVYLGHSATGKPRRGARVPWYDWLFLLAGAAGVGFVAFFYDRVLEYGTYGYLDTPGIILALLLALALLEGVRRLTGWIFPLIVVFFLLVARYQDLLPGALAGVGYSLDRQTYAFYVGSGGIFGLPLGVATSILIVFLLFAGFLERAGAGRWFIDLALALTGWMRGGPAKAAVLASAFFGSISGSPAANTATTGTFTVPLMKRVGYSPAFAGAVEAVASTGGQILPPVMGAVAFVMAEWIGVTYADVVVAAAVPAILYFIVVFVSVHFQALKDDVKPIPRGELPRLRDTFLSGWFYLLPLAALLYFFLVKRLSPDIAGIYSLPILIACSFLAKERGCWLTPARLWEALGGSVKAWLTVAMVTAAVGMLVSSLELSGLGVKLSAFIVDLGGGNLMLTLAFVGVASLVLGMGLDSLPAYITLATLTAPALVKLGMSAMSAHLFVIYWGLASFVTPPVCIAVYVACGISGGKIWETGWEAVRLGIAAYLISFAFALNPALLLRGGLADVTLGVVTAFFGAAAIAIAVRGYGLGPMNIPQRLLMLIGGLLLIGPGALTALLAVLLVGVSLLWQRLAPVEAPAWRAGSSM